MSREGGAGETLVIVGGVLIDGTGAGAISSPVVVVRDDRIVSVASSLPGQDPPAHERLIDASGCTLLPGLIDTHLHLAPVHLPAGLSSTIDGDPAPAYLTAISKGQSALLGGVTTARDCGGPGMFNVRLRDARDAGLWVGPRLLASGYPLTTTAGHCHWMGGRADDGPSLRRGVRLLAEHGVDFIKVMVTGGMMTPGSNPYRPQYSVEELRPAVEDAHRLDLRVAAHVLCTEGVQIATASGVDTIEHGWTITGRRQDFDPVVIDPLLQRGTTASVTAHESLRSLLPSRASGGDLAELRRRLVPHRALRAAGVPMVVHSDAGGGATRFDDFAESIEVFATGMDVDLPGAINAGTGSAAAALGRAADLGTLEPGRLADIVIAQGDVSRDISALRRVRDVFIGGAEVVRDGRIVTTPRVRM